MAWVPDGRSLVEKFEDRPFTLLGVNVDAPAENLAERTRAADIPWRSLADGGSTGPLTTAWGVRAFPTTFLIDHEGVVRGVDLHGEALEVELERLLAAAEEQP